MANYQAGPFIAAALESLLASTLSNIEVIVVDDASRDDGLAIALAIAARDSRVRVEVMAVNSGPAATRNRALSLARGRWVAIVDSDDLIEPGRFERLIAAADSAGVDIVADDMLIFDNPSAEGGSAKLPRRFLKAADRTARFRLDLSEFLRRSVLYAPEPAPGFLKPLIRREAWAASDVRYNEDLRISEDEHLIARLLLAGLSYLVVPEPGYHYRKHSGSISHRMSVATVAAMVAADRALAADVLEQRPDLAGICALRARALVHALAFERMLAALKHREVGAAVRLAATNPRALVLFRMPLAGLARKVAKRLRGAVRQGA